MSFFICKSLYLVINNFTIHNSHFKLRLTQFQCLLRKLFSCGSVTKSYRLFLPLQSLPMWPENFGTTSTDSSYDDSLNLLVNDDLTLLYCSSVYCCSLWKHSWVSCDDFRSNLPI